MKRYRFSVSKIRDNSVGITFIAPSMTRAQKGELYEVKPIYDFTQYRYCAKTVNLETYFIKKSRTSRDYIVFKKVYSISETRKVLTIPLSVTGIAARLIKKSPFSTKPFSRAIWLMSVTVSSVLTNLS